ncbi:MAG: hypothetical protein MUC50_17400 [Myxococcota bacterium]|jgi:hypothetical protein|nr:hypothetical protein [Myxococcota bacterium]
MIKLAPVALLLLAAVVPMCTGTIWGNLLILAIASGIFLGTVCLGSEKTSNAQVGLPEADN